MLKNRLIFGTLMTVIFTGMAVFDGWMDGSLTSAMPDKKIQGSILCVIMVLLAIPAQFEFSRLATAKKLKIFKPVAIPVAILFATAWYWPQFLQIQMEYYLAFLAAFSLLVLLLYQYLFYGTTEVITNCGVNYFSIIYLGLLSAFVLAIRIKFGLWPLLMFVFTIKSSDIGAYTVGSLFGKNKFSPKISPGKTWEGMAGAVIIAIIVAVIFAVSCGIMVWWLAAVFGLCFAFIGQLGDLVESMLKRDVEQKDSAKSIPGFGGILDVIDSPLAAAPFAYIFFMCLAQ